MTLILHWLLNWLIGWGGLSILVAIGAAAVWWFVPAIFTKARALAFNVAVGALSFNAVYTMGFQNGASTTKAEWEAAEQRGVERGSDAREQAEQEIPPAVEQPAPLVCPEPVPAPGSTAPKPRRPAPVPQWMRDDRNNRDNR